MEYVRNFRQVAGRLRSWPEHLLVHHFWAGLDWELRQACVIMGVPNQLQEWFQVVVELDTGLQEFRRRGEDPLTPWRVVESPRDDSHRAQAPVPGPSGPPPRPMFRCFQCSQPGHQAAECPVPVPWSSPSAPGKSGSMPKRTTEWSQAVQQPEDDNPRRSLLMGGEGTSTTSYQPAEYDSADDFAEDPMVSQPVCPFAIPSTLTSPQTGHRGEYKALIDSGCTRCLISKDVVANVGIRVRRLTNPIRFEQVDGSLLEGASGHSYNRTCEDGGGPLGGPLFHCSPLHD